MSLKRQTVWSMLPLLVVTVVNVFSVPLFYRYLGAELYALWFYVITFTGLFGFADLGLGIAVSRYVGIALGRGDQAAVREYWGTGNLIAVPLLLGMGLAFAVLGIVGGTKWFNVAPEHLGMLRGCFAVGGAALFVGYYSQFWIVLIQSHLEFKATNLLRVVGSVAQVLVALLLAWRTHNPLWMSLGTLGVGILQLVVLFWCARKQTNLRFEFAAARMARAREMAAYTAKTFLALVVNAVFASVDRIGLGKVAPPGEFVNYNIAGNLGNRLQGLAVAVMGPVFHNTNRSVGAASRSDAARIFDEMFLFLFQWYSLAAVWAVVWHPVLLPLWLGLEVGQKVAAYVPPLVVAYCFNALMCVSASQLNALNRVGAGTGFTVTTGLLTLAGIWLGWRWGGAVGVAYGYLASRIGVVAQDVFVMRLIQARGWAQRRVWLILLGQVVVAAGFGASYLLCERGSFWLIGIAGVHLVAVAAWWLRRPLLGLIKTGSLAGG